jgi:hypothetical protein
MCGVCVVLERLMNKLMMKREEKKRGSGGYGVRERKRGRGNERTTYKGVCIRRVMSRE